MTTSPYTGVEGGTNNLAVNLSNGFSVSLKLDAGCVRGIGSVKYRGRDLRNDDYIIRPYLQSMDGLAFERFKLVDVQTNDGVTRIVTEVLPAQGTELEWQDGFNHNFIVMPKPDSSLQPVTMVWEIGEYSEDVYGKTVPGFYYSFELRSEAEFHSFMEQGSWEINRLSKPVTVIAQRAGGGPWETKVGIEDRFHTYESADSKVVNTKSEIQIREGIVPEGEVVFWQMMPRGSGSQTFDFQATDDGWIAVYNPEPGYIQACMCKQPGMQAIGNLERHYFEKRSGAASGRKVVLAHFPEGGLGIEQIRDDWSDVFDTVNDLWRDYYGYPEDPLDTCYSPTMWNAVLDADPLAYRRVLDMIPTLASYGVKRLFHGIWWKSHYTEDRETHDICAIMEYVCSEKNGGDALLKEIVDKAHEYGIEVFTWFLSAISRTSPMVQGHPDWVCIDRNGAPLAAIGHPALYVMDLNSGWGDYFAERVLETKERLGIDGVFIDSYHNLCFQPINYADPKIRTNASALVRWQKRMRDAGLKFMIETQGIYGTSLNWLERGMVKIEGNAGVEHAFYKSLQCIKTPWIQSGLIDESLCYRSTANNGPIRTETDFPTLDQVELPKDIWEGFLARINRDYQAVRDRMIRRRTLSDDRGVEWMDEKREKVLALYSFAEFSYSVSEGMRLFDVTNGQHVSVTDGYARLMKFHTYRVDREV